MLVFNYRKKNLNWENFKHFISILNTKWKTTTARGPEDSSEEIFGREGLWLQFAAFGNRII